MATETKVKWTPGPWTADGKVTGWWGGEQPGCMVRFWEGNIGKPVANCLEQATGKEASEANARLIAKAPAMYDLLRRYYNNAKDHETYWDVERLLAELENF